MTKPYKIKKYSYFLISILALYTFIGFFLAPWLGEKILIKQLDKALERPVTISSISMNPFSLVVGINGLSIKEKTGADFISVHSFLIDLSIASLFKLSPVISRLELESPIVNIVLNKDETFNFSDLIENLSKKPGDSSLDDSAIVDSEKAGSNFFGFKLSNAKIFNGKISFSDQVREKDHLIEHLNFKLPFLSSMERDRQTKAWAEFDFLLNQVPIKIKLESLPFSPGLDSVVTLRTGTIDLLTYLGYLSLPETLMVRQMETSLDLSITYSQAVDKDKPSLILKGGVGLANIDIQDIDHTPILTIPQINLTIIPSDILDKKLVLSDLKIQSPKIQLSRDSQGKLNILTYLPGADSPDKGEDQTTKAVESDQKNANKGFVFQLGTGEITDASLVFMDRANKSPFKTTLSSVFIQVQDIVAEKGVAGKYGLSLKTEAGESLNSTGQFSTIPMEIEGTLFLEKLVLKKYMPLLEPMINFDIQDGEVHLDAGFQLSGSQAEFAGVINNKELGLTNLKVWDRVNKEILVSIPELVLNDSVINTEKQSVDLGRIKTVQGKILLKRQADGSINLVKNVFSSNPVTVEEKNPAKATPAISVDKNKSSTWGMSLNDFSMEKFELAFVDEATKEPVSVALSDISIHANNLKSSGKEKSGIQIGMEWNKTGKIQVKGDIVPSELSADLDISIDQIDIQSLQPYFTEHLNIVVSKGFFQTQGRIGISLDNKGNKKVDTKKDPLLFFKGKTSITDFASLGKISGKELFNCNSLYLSDMDISLFPVKVTVKDISLTDFYSRVIISEKGNINLKQILAGDEQEKTISTLEPARVTAKETSRLGPEIRISNVTLQGGRIYYSDYFTQPNVTAEMKEIAGQIKGLSSLDNSTPAEIQLRGLHGQSSPLDILGRISPLTRKQFIDLDISFKDIDLTRFSPYAAKYIGYKIEKGKLVLDLKYLINGNVLESQNSLFLDQFTLGEKVDSDVATSLPVPLAISLLKNSEGQIDLNLPITGNLNDPAFNFSGAVFEVFGNLIMKVISAPFKFLGTLFEGGEELGFVNFEYGNAAISDEGIKKLDKLIQILEQKKALALEIEGTYDRVQDGEVLRKKQYEALLKLEKIKKMAAKGTPTASLEKTILLAEEREAAIQAVYEVSDFPKPREEDGREKEITTLEKAKLLLTHVDITENALKQLAMNRAENIKNYILASDKVAPARVYLRDPDQVEADPESKGYSQVKFLIK